MTQFLKSLFTSCLGTMIAIMILFFILMGIGSSLASKGMEGGQSVHIPESGLLKVSIPEILPEQTNNTPLAGFSFKDEKTIGVHDLAQSIRNAAKDSKIKGIYLTGQSYQHGYATLKIIRDALLEFKESGKPIVGYTLFLDHKNYFLLSVADQLIMHPLGFADLRGFAASIPFFKEMMEKIGLSFNIYYAGEFKSATEPFRLAKMSPENRLQLSEYLNAQLDEYCVQVSKSRMLSSEELKSIFHNYKASSPAKAVEQKIIDGLNYELDAIKELKSKAGIEAGTKTEFVSIQDYFKVNGKSEQDYNSKSRIAVVFAEGNIIDGKGEEGQIGRKYLKILKDIRENKNIKAMVLRVNSGGGSAIMSDEILHEIDQMRTEGKPVVVSMGDYAASGGYYISCHADSIFASPHTLTGSIGVFAMIPNVKILMGDKIGIDVDTVGTGPLSSRFNPNFEWGPEESAIIQENVDQVYETFLGIVAKGRSMSREEVHEVARGRIWTGKAARELGLISAIGELPDAIKAAASLASVERYKTEEYPRQKDPFQKFLDQLQGNDEVSSRLKESILRENLGEYYPYLNDWKNIRNSKGVQMLLPVKPAF
ncbi:MAG: signal peptide peptidase SppA [Saprospiraceae bacterium]|nr:signal peptide peptidase SppA [Saprospiraceae bacterium]